MGRSVLRAAARSAGVVAEVVERRVLFSGTASVSGFVFNTATGAGYAGGTVYLDLNNDGKQEGNEYGVAADRYGHYAIGALPDGTYTLREAGVGTGYAQTFPTGGPQTVTVTAGQSQTNVSFGNTATATPATGSISGFVYNAVTGVGFAGATVYLDANGNGADDVGEPNVPANAYGYYTFTNLPAGTYAVRDANIADGYELPNVGANLQTVTLVSGQQAANVGFGLRPGGEVAGQLSNANGTALPGTFTVYDDLNGNGKPDAGEPSVATTASGSAQAYDLAGLPFGRATVRVAPPAGSAYAVTTPAAGYQTATLDSDAATANGVNFAVSASGTTAATGSITGFVYNAATGKGFAGGTVYLDLNNDGTREPTEYGIAANAYGYYSVGLLPAGTYTLRLANVAAASAVTAPASGAQSVTLAAGQQAANVSFGLSPATAAGGSLGADGTLTVTGTAGGDTIEVNLGTGGNQAFKVTVNGAAENYFESDVKAIVVNAGAGDDTVRVDGSYTTSFTAPGYGNLPITVNGGDGNDVVGAAVDPRDNTGVGVARPVLNGDGGNDVLYVDYGGDATLNGGAGDDRFGADGDISGGNEVIAAGDGNDTIYGDGDTGYTSVDGGAGTNTFDTVHNLQLPGGGFSRGSEYGEIDGSQKVIRLSGANFTNVNTVITGDLVTEVDGTDGPDVITFHDSLGSPGVTVRGNGGDDLIDVRGADVAYVDAGAGTDTVYANATGDTVVNAETVVGLTANKLVGSVIGTAGSYNNHGTTVAKAFDNDLTTYFDGPTATGDWAGLDLGSAKAVTQVRFAPRADLPGRMVGGQFQASATADFSSGVVTLYTVTTTPAVGQLTTVQLSNVAAYRYYRYLGPANSYGDVAELEFDG